MPHTMQAAHAAAMTGGTVLLRRTVVGRELVSWIAGVWRGCRMLGRVQLEGYACGW